MIRVVLVSDYEEKFPPERLFTVLSAGPVQVVPDTSEVRIEVSVAQLQEILRGCWKLLPPCERPCP